MLQGQVNIFCNVWKCILKPHEHCQVFKRSIQKMLPLLEMEAKIHSKRFIQRQLKTQSSKLVTLSG